MTEPSGDEIQVHEGRRVGMTVSLRLRPEEAEILTELVRRYDATVSETVRLALNALAKATDYTIISGQSSGLGAFSKTRTEPLSLFALTA